MNGQLFYGTILGFASGVLLRSFVQLGVEFIWLLLLLVVTVVVLNVTSLSGRRLLSRQVSVMFLCVIVTFGIGVARFSIDEITNADEIFDEHLEQEVELVGAVTGESVATESGQRYVLTVEELHISDEKINITDEVVRVAVWADAFPEVVYGDRVRLAGELAEPESFVTETNRRFDYPTYLAKDEVFYLMYYPVSTAVISSGHGNWLKGMLYSVRRTYLQKIQSQLPAPHAGLLGGLTVGSEDAMGEELEADFRTTGISHIVVLSGYNVSVIADALMRITALPMQARLILAGALIFLFVILTGASATIVRAGIMAGLVIAATLFSRRYAIVRALCMAGAVMVFVNPYILAFDLSFQLSFLATYGLILLAPILVTFVSRVPTKLGLREAVVATVATQIFVLPFILFSIGQISLVSLVTNILILPTVPWVMFTGFLMSLLGFLGGALAIPVAFPLTVVTYGLLAYELQVVEILSALPFAQVAVPAFSGGILVGSYALYGGLIWWYQRQD